MTPSRHTRFRIGMVALALLAVSCAGGGALQGGGDGGDGGGGSVVVGAVNFAENLILGEMYAALLEDRGVSVDLQPPLSSREVLFPAVESGEVDLVPEYTGALLDFLTGGESTVTTPDEVYAELQEELPEDIVALEPSEAQDKDGLAVLPSTAEQHDLATYSDLAPVSDQLVAGGPPEERTREVGLPGLKRVYGIEFAEFVPLDAGGPLTTEALNSGDIDVARVFTTQSVIDVYDWVVLDDDKELVPAQNIVPVGRAEALTGDIQTALNELSATITSEDLIALNKQVEIDKEDPEEVARAYLEEEGMLEGGPGG